MIKDKKPYYCMVGLWSGVTWSLYTLGLYYVLNVYSGLPSIHDLSNLNLIILLALGAMIIAIVDSTIAFLVEVYVIYKSGYSSQLLSMIKSKKMFRMMPAAILAGLFGIVPYAIASNVSPLAGSISMIYPVVGAVSSRIVLKHKLNIVQWISIVLACLVSVVLGTVGAGTLGVGLLPVMLGVITSIGWGLEAIFGYRLMKDNINPIVTIALRHLNTIILLLAILGVSLILNLSDISSLSNVLSSININYGISSGFIIPIFVISSAIGSLSYMAWYISMNKIGVPVAMSLNISYGIWTPMLGVLLGTRITMLQLVLLILLFICIVLVVVFQDRKINLKILSNKKT